MHGYEQWNFGKGALCNRQCTFINIYASAKISKVKKKKRLHIFLANIAEYAAWRLYAHYEPCRIMSPHYISSAHLCIRIGISNQRHTSIRCKKVRAISCNLWGLNARNWGNEKNCTRSLRLEWSERKIQRIIFVQSDEQNEKTYTPIAKNHLFQLSENESDGNFATDSSLQGVYLRMETL